MISSIAFAMLLFHTIKSELNTCMGIPFITDEEVFQLAINQVELDNIVCLEDILVPYDQSSRKIYLPCNITEETKFHDLEGQLTSVLPEYNLYFLWEGAFNIMKEAVKYSCNFTLYAIDSSGNYATYSVIFTTLPIIDMHGEISYVDERDRDVYTGNVTVWEPNQKDTERLIVQDSQLEWHVRGFSSSSLPLPPLKLKI